MVPPDAFGHGKGFMHTKLIGGTLMHPGPGRTVRFARGTVRIEDQTIAAVEETEDITGHDLGGDDYLICPGFIDTHLHLPQFDSIGIDGLELLDWLDRVIFPAETCWEDPDYAEAMTERVLDQLASFGTTSFAAYATVHHEAARRAVSMIKARGVRAMVGQVLMDRNAPTELVRPARQLVREAEALFDDAGGRVEVAVTPRFAVSCSNDLLEAAGTLARKSGAPVQTHLAETRRECALIGELFDGLPYTEVYKRAGLLGPRSIFGHGIWLDDQDRTMLADSSSIVAHCPTANLFLDAGRHDRSAALSAGVKVTLGSDVAGGPDRSMVRVAQAMIETAKNRGDTPPTAAEAWWQITRGNAEALGWGGSKNAAEASGGVGTLRPGAEADLLIIRPTIDWQHTPDPAGTLLYAWDDRWLDRTIITGRPVWLRE
jgi:guanine deaminase